MKRDTSAADKRTKKFAVVLGVLFLLALCGQMASENDSNTTVQEQEPQVEVTEEPTPVEPETATAPTEPVSTIRVMKEENRDKFYASANILTDSSDVSFDYYVSHFGDGYEMIHNLGNTACKEMVDNPSSTPKYVSETMQSTFISKLPAHDSNDQMINDVKVLIDSTVWAAAAHLCPLQE
ncbi:hypothetical protein IQ230_09645 [Gloeocapsopsis crepidinum LEGE 06123]|uniref:DUF732 domain-containing protein n=1 Tax=Gloeocapsopsis crepidinum LEGE 06123 TaxID=588587 RepID=A0ABR9UQR7_9CHRO|nr:hypothetical protein [Gloeocapsopsis crepidinum]MBE9190619.1 hypothetical protein [Gloeocapsopsis crepidinum LEGE 06123]